MPQCASEIFTPKRTFRRPVRIGLPTCRLSHGIASPWIVPSKREPITRSSPAARRSTNGASSRSGYVSSASPITMKSPRACGESGQVGAAVAGPLLADDDRAVLGGDLRRAVGRGVVDDDHLARAPRAADPLPCLVDDGADRVLLVQARDHDRDLGRLHGGIIGNAAAGESTARGDASPPARGVRFPVVTGAEVER